MFVVDIQVKPGNRIQVYLDQPDGIAIETCVAFSRLIESSLDRELEDFELQVSSPGLDQPLKVTQQYHKNLGRTLKIIDIEGNKHKGLLAEVDNSGILLQAEVKVKKEGSKRKSTEIQPIRLEYINIKTAKVHLEF